MKKSISFILLGAALLAVLLSGCDAAGGNEPSTDNSEAFLSVIEKSSPITSGNLITKTKTDEDGNIIVQYYDNENNLVEYFTWDDGWDDLIEHAVMTYSESDKIMSKEIIDPEGKENIYTSYQYDSDDNLLQYTVSEYKDGLLHKATVFDSSDKETGYTLSYYNDSAKVTKVERYDSHDDLCEYYMYEYDKDGRTSKYSEYLPGEQLQKYTEFAYDESGRKISEKYYNGENQLLNYYVFSYYSDGTMKTSEEYDSSGKLVSQNYFEQTTSAG